MHWEGIVLLKDSNIGRDSWQMISLQFCKGPLVRTNFVSKVPPIVCHVLQLLPESLHQGHPVLNAARGLSPLTYVMLLKLHRHIRVSANFQHDVMWVETYV